MMRSLRAVGPGAAASDLAAGATVGVMLIPQGMGYAMQLKPEQTMKDVSAALNDVKHAGRVGAVGYCWGGTLAYLAACELPVA